MELFGNRVVAPYAGQTQTQQIAIPASIAYQQVWEESCWVMPPYASFYPGTAQAGPAEVWVPPPVKQIDIFTAQQTWPL